MVTMDDFKLTRDPLVSAILKRANDRANQGLSDYGGTMADAKKPVIDWIGDAQEELWDAIVYLEKVKNLLGGNS